MSPSTLIIGATPRVVIPLARCLAGHSIPVIAASLMPDTPPMRSRALRGYHYLRPPSLSSELFRHDLQQVIDRYQVDTVIPTGDEVLSALAVEEAYWRQQLHLLCPPAEIAAQVLNKSQTLAAAERLGVPLPQSRLLTDSDELDERIEGLCFPLIAKPADKGRSNRLRLRHLDSRDALGSFVGRQFRVGDAWMLQEYLPGHGVGVEVLMHSGEAVTVFQHRRLKEYPVDGGVAARCASEAPDPSLRDHAVALLRHIGWEGVAMVEFRYDPATGRTALMEINGRYWGSVALPLQCGIEFPWYEWQLAHDQKPTPQPYPCGRRMRWLAGDLQRLTEVAGAVAAREYPIGRALGDAGSFVTDFVDPRTQDALWQWREPGPALRDGYHAFRAVTAQISDKFVRKLLPVRWRVAMQPLVRLGAGGAVRYLLLAVGANPTRPPPCAVSQARRILFVCHGNIIRSAFAAASLEQHLHRRGGDPQIVVESAGVAALDGSPADPDAVAAARALGVSLEQHRAHRLTAAMVEAADLIFVMDRFNQVRLHRAFPDARQKMWLLGTLHPAAAMAGQGQQIADPYGASQEAVTACFQLLAPCVEALAKEMLIECAPTPRRARQSGPSRHTPDAKQRSGEGDRH